MAKRRSYEVRTRANTAAASILAKAFNPDAKFAADGARVWAPEDMQRYKLEDIALALRGKRAVEFEELVEDVPPSAVKYAVTKGWLVKAAAGFYCVTEKAASELRLPRKADGLTIRFLKVA